MLVQGMCDVRHAVRVCVAQSANVCTTEHGIMVAQLKVVCGGPSHDRRRQSSGLRVSCAADSVNCCMVFTTRGSLVGSSVLLQLVLVAGGAMDRTSLLWQPVAWVQHLLLWQF